MQTLTALEDDLIQWAHVNDGKLPSCILAPQDQIEEWRRERKVPVDRPVVIGGIICKPHDGPVEIVASTLDRMRDDPSAHFTVPEVVGALMAFTNNAGGVSPKTILAGKNQIQEWHDELKNEGQLIDDPAYHEPPRIAGIPILEREGPLEFVPGYAFSNTQIHL